MAQANKLYIAGTGMITPLGFDTASTVAAVRAGVCAYQLSEFDDEDGHTIKMAHLPEEAYMSFTAEIDEGDFYNDHYDHVIKLSHVAIREAFADNPIDAPVPLCLGLPEPVEGINHITRSALVKNLMASGELPVAAEQIKTFATGRASGIHAIEMAQRYFSAGNAPYVLIGASDSYYNFPMIRRLAEDKRLLTEVSEDGFVPGESAGFILLTNRIENAMVNDGRAICVHSPGTADEQGHLYSKEVNKGEGLDKALKAALTGQLQDKVSRIYSSVNGEHFWAKELGVATIRNSGYFESDCRVEHPVDCLGDMGAATAPVLMGLAAADLLADKQLGSALIYSSSDYASRAAVRIESIAA